MSRVIVWGAGELGGRICEMAKADGHRVLAYTRTEERHETLLSLGAEVACGDPSDWHESDILILCIAGTNQLDEAIARVADRPPPARVVITSSTGYYNGLGGGINEHTEAGPTDRAKGIEAMEQRFRSWTKKAGVIMRLGGLYRPGRGPLNMLRKRGFAPPGAPNNTLALIHYEDAARAVYQAGIKQSVRPAYIVVSPPCPTRHEFYLAASVILALPLPSFGRPLALPKAEYDVDALRQDLLPVPVHGRWQSALVP